jgi:outer membrane receptor for ferrienterochelin and colicins
MSGVVNSPSQKVCSLTCNVKAIPRLLKYQVLCLFACFHVTAVCAVEAESPETLKVLSLEELMQVKVDTVYAASRYKQEITEAPSSVSVVTSDEIKKFGYRTLADILSGIRGFYITYDRSYYAVGIRGVNINGDYGGRILLTVNGHRLNDPIYDTAATGMDQLVDVDLIERVEVIRGPGSSVYGNNSFFGTINIITRDGESLRGAEASASAGSFDTYTGRVSIGHKFTNGIQFLLSGTLYESAGDRRLFFPEFETINNGIAEDMDRAYSRHVFGNVSWKSLSLEGGFVNYWKRWPTAPYSTEDATTIFNDPHFRVIDERGYGNLKFQHTFENGFDVMARVYYDHYLSDAHYPYDYFDPLNPVTINADYGRSESWGTEVYASRTLWDKHHMTFGGEVRWDTRMDLENRDIDPPATYLNMHKTGRFLSLYGQDEFRIFDNLILNVGLRYDHFSTFGEALNPRIALIYHPTESASLKLLYGQAYRAPNGYESFYILEGSKFNPELEPETIQSYELVYEQKLGKSWRTTASLFFNDIDGLIGVREDPDDGLLFSDNLDSVQSKGAEIEIDGRWSNGLRALASYSYSYAENATTERQMGNSPEHLAKLSLSAPVWSDKVFASVELQGMTKRRTPLNESVGGYWVANATLFSRELVKGLDVSLSVYNLFNERYRDPAGGSYPQDAIQQDGRTWRVKVTYRF